jgi:hypothetical protein
MANPKSEKANTLAHTHAHGGTPAYLVKYPHLTNKKWTEHQIRAYADAALQWYETNYLEPYFKQYFADQKLRISQVYRWVSTDEYFEGVWEILAQMQEMRLGKLGLNKDTNSSFAQFAMENNTTWTRNPAPTEEEDVFTLVDNWPSGNQPK